MTHIAGLETDPDDTTLFYSRGSEIADLMLSPTLKRLGFDPQGATVLDIGCGIGRFFPGFQALGFGQMWGIDVSQEMIIQARKVCPVENARFIVGDGRNFTEIDDQSVDFCWSYVVLQHLPETSIVWGYLDELSRVLVPGGAFYLHFRGRYSFRQKLQKLKGKILGLIPRAGHVATFAIYRLLAFRWLRGQSVFGEAQAIPGNLATITGVATSRTDVLCKLKELGFVDLEITDDPTHANGTRFWVTGRNPS
jgi:SAM-dependent methyltransferase